VPRHVAQLVTRLVTPLVVDYSASRRLIVDYFTSAARPGAWARRALVTRLVAPLVVYYSTSHRLVVDYFTSAVRPGASARRTALHAARRAARRRLLHLAQACRRLLLLRRASGCLGTSRGSSCVSSPRSSSTTSPPPHVRVPRHAARLVMRLVAPLVVDYSASRRLVVDYFTSAA
jgi:hypothetical protein